MNVSSGLLRLWVASSLLVVSGLATGQNILILGDSLSAAHGIPLEAGWVELLRQRLEQSFPDFTVVNGSQSGETSEGALTRLPGLLNEYHPVLAVIEIGGNDGLRGLPLDQLLANLRSMIRTLRNHRTQVLLLEMRLPPSYGPAYTQGFQAVYGAVAEETDVQLVPFFLEGVGGHPQWMQEDGIHPNADAQPQLLNNLWPHLDAQLRKLAHNPARINRHTEPDPLQATDRPTTD